jgi:hypothetical protein
MAGKRTDPLGLSIMAAILATRYGPLAVTMQLKRATDWELIGGR